MIEILENAILAALEPELKKLNIKCELFPELIQRLNRPLSGDRVLIGYQGSELAINEQAVQIRRASILITLQFKDLRSHQGAYKAIDMIYKILRTLEVFPGYGECMPERDNFEEIDENGTWLYSLVFSTYTPVI